MMKPTKKLPETQKNSYNWPKNTKLNMYLFVSNIGYSLTVYYKAQRDMPSISFYFLQLETGTGICLIIWHVVLAVLGKVGAALQTHLSLIQSLISSHSFPYQNCITGSKVVTILLDGGILHIGGVASGSVDYSMKS